MYYKKKKHFLMLKYFEGCGGYFDTSNGTLQYPVSNTTATYPSNTNCVWTIEVNSSRVINISLVWIDIEKTNICSFDYLEVKNIY